MRDEISDYFALTVFKLAKGHSKKELTDVEKELSSFADYLSSNNEFFQFLNHPCISMSEKSKLISKLVSVPLSLRLVLLLVKMKKIKAVIDIADIFSTLIKIEDNFIDVEAKVAYDIDEKEKDLLKKSIEDYTGKKINLMTVTDPEIIGGVYLKIGNLVIDYTLSKELNFFKERFNTK